MSEDEKPCPLCGRRMTPIVYGYPSIDMLNAADRGDVLLGGCVPYGDDERWRCSVCAPTKRRPARTFLFRSVAEAYALGGGEDLLPPPA